MFVNERQEWKTDTNEPRWILPVLFFERAIQIFNMPGVKHWNTGPWSKVSSERLMAIAHGSPRWSPILVLTLTEPNVAQLQCQTRTGISMWLRPQGLYPTRCLCKVKICLKHKKILIFFYSLLFMVIN